MDKGHELFNPKPMNFQSQHDWYDWNQRVEIMVGEVMKDLQVSKDLSKEPRYRDEIEQMIKDAKALASNTGVDGPGREKFKQAFRERWEPRLLEMQTEYNDSKKKSMDVSPIKEKITFERGSTYIKGKEFVAPLSEEKNRYLKEQSEKNKKSEPLPKGLNLSPLYGYNTPEKAKLIESALSTDAGIAALGDFAKGYGGILPLPEKGQMDNLAYAGVLMNDIISSGITPEQLNIRLNDIASSFKTSETYNKMLASRSEQAQQMFETELNNLRQSQSQIIKLG